MYIIFSDYLDKHQPKSPHKLESNFKRNHDLSVSNRSSDSSSSLNSDPSFLEIYWEDFDAENKLKNPHIKQMNIESIFPDERIQLEKLEKEINYKFKPSDPPLLKYYNELKNIMRLPSKKYLEMEKRAFHDQLVKIRKLVKKFVKRAQLDAKLLTK